MSMYDTSRYLYDCGITSDDLIWLFGRLTQLKASSPNPCSKLESWYLDNNLIDDSGASALIDHLPSLFPRLGRTFSDPNIKNNPVSVEMMKRLKDELRKRRGEVSYSILVLSHAILISLPRWEVCSTQF